MRKRTAARRPLVMRPRSRFGDDGHHFRIERPWATHWSPVSCRDVECEHYTCGWVTVVPAESEQADYIRRLSGREFTEERREGGLSAFSFPAGQQCFRQHRRPEREDYAHVHRGVRQIHERFEDWSEHMNEETDKVRRVRERG